MRLAPSCDLIGKIVIKEEHTAHIGDIAISEAAGRYTLIGVWYTNRKISPVVVFGLPIVTSAIGTSQIVDFYPKSDYIWIELELDIRIKKFTGPLTTFGRDVQCHSCAVPGALHEKPAAFYGQTDGRIEYVSMKINFTMCHQP
uniref:Uncharacterized protein n=1 Tax=Romanomermis culicivorax TaxID=13658 RepID=A0A915L882_ROMCU